MVIFRSIVIFMALAAFLSMGAGCSSNEAPDKLGSVSKEEQPAAQTSDEQPAAVAQEKQPEGTPEQAAKQAPKTLALTGTVAQDGDKMVLSTDLGDYVIAGQDMSAMVGKTVNVTGAVEEINGEYTINVLSFTQE